MVRTEVSNFINSLNNENLNLLLGYLENIYVELSKKSKLSNSTLFDIIYFKKLKNNIKISPAFLLELKYSNLSNYTMDLNYLIELIYYVRSFIKPVINNNLDIKVKELLDNTDELRLIRWFLIRLKEKYSNHIINDRSLSILVGGMSLKLSRNDVRILLDLQIIGQSGYNNVYVYNINNNIDDLLNYIYLIKPLESLPVLSSNKPNIRLSEVSFVNRLINLYGFDVVKNYIYELFDNLKLDINPHRKLTNVDYLLFKPDYDIVNNKYYNICSHKLLGRLLQSQTMTLKVNDKYTTCYKVSMDIIKTIAKNLELVNIDLLNPKDNLNDLIKLCNKLESDLK